MRVVISRDRARCRATRRKVNRHPSDELSARETPNRLSLQAISPITARDVDARAHERNSFLPERQPDRANKFRFPHTDLSPHKFSVLIFRDAMSWSNRAQAEPASSSFTHAGRVKLLDVKRLYAKRQQEEKVATWMTTTAALSEEHRAWLNEHLDRNGLGWEIASVMQGRKLFKAGDEVTRTILVLKGLIKLNVERDGKTVLHEIRPPGSWLGDAVGNGRCHHRHAAVAAMASEVVVFPRATFNKTLDDHPALNALYRSGLENHVGTLKDALDDQHFASSATRLARLFRDHFTGENANADELRYETTPTKVGQLIGYSRQTVNDTIRDKLDPAGAVKKMSTNVYHLYRQKLEEFLAGNRD
ncbi:Crp/Fnr family transcriptional regulator [Bradyrhizobium sp. S3.5.5]|uniref:Crp/Fnr family transcriptional regulator n=1 Tax=Bradyrhizobium sp. S3.5.5 TaxID=3156430 RepID=UPI003392E84C